MDFHQHIVIPMWFMFKSYGPERIPDLFMTLFVFLYFGGANFTCEPVSHNPLFVSQRAAPNGSRSDLSCRDNIRSYWQRLYYFAHIFSMVNGGIYPRTR